MLPLIAAGALLSPIMGLISGAKQKKVARKAAKQAEVLNQQSIGYANDQLGLSRGLLAQSKNNYYGRMAGAGQMEQNIYANQANTIGGISRNASSGSQLLALAGAAQGQSNNAFGGLAMAEAQNKQQRFGDVQNATRGLGGAYNNLQNVYGDQAQMASQSANANMQAGMTNQANAFNNISNFAMMAGMGEFGEIGKGGGGGGNQMSSMGGGASPFSSYGGGNLMNGSMRPKINFSIPSTPSNFTRGWD